jgi:sialidase-1
MMFERQIVFEQGAHAFYHVPSLVVAPDGSVLAFCEERWRSPCDDTGECHIVMKKSMDDGRTWGDLIHLQHQDGAKYHMGSAVSVPDAGKVLLMCGGGWLQSMDYGDTWKDWQPDIQVLAGTSGGDTHGSAPGIVKQYGPCRGRIVWPARTIVSNDGYNDLSIPDRQTKCYSMAWYSDDGGASINSSNYFLQGTGEACLAERLNGDLYLNARAYFNDGQRYIGISRDGGAHIVEATPDRTLREVRQGCNASLVRYPPDLCDERDLLLFANPDSSGKTREHGMLRVSFDGGHPWPLQKEIAPWGAWFDYSAMTISRKGTILLIYKTTPSMSELPVSADKCCSMALVRFDLDWLGLPG